MKYCDHTQDPCPMCGPSEKKINAERGEDSRSAPCSAIDTCRNPLAPTDKPYPIPTVLRQLASQESCDGDPWDQMIAAADYITHLEGCLRETQMEYFKLLSKSHLLEKALETVQQNAQDQA